MRFVLFNFTFCLCLFCLCCLFPCLTINLYYFDFVFLTRLRGFLVCILWSWFLFCCCFDFCWFFVFFTLLNKRTPPKKRTLQKIKSRYAENTDKNQLAQLCLQIVFLNFWGGFKNSIFAWKHYKWGGNIFWKWPKHVKKGESKFGPRLGQNSVQVCCAT